MGNWCFKTPAMGNFTGNLGNLLGDYDKIMIFSVSAYPVYNYTVLKTN